MAIFEKFVGDGIQLGNAADYCFKCVKPGDTITEENSLDYKETFKLNINGLSYCLCLEHLQQILGDYKLVHKDTINNEDCISIPKQLIKEGTQEEVLAFIEKAML